MAVVVVTLATTMAKDDGNRRSSGRGNINGDISNEGGHQSLSYFQFQRPGSGINGGKRIKIVKRYELK